jgi:hypothetical protein
MTSDTARAPDVIRLLDQLFNQRWYRLHAAGWDKDKQLKFPGVYLLAYTPDDLEGQRIKIDDVCYVGMSNAKGGVRARLKQFMSGIEKGRGHSAGDFFYRKNKKPFSELRGREKFYFATLCRECSTGDKSDAMPDDFRMMGAIACLEYYAIAHVREHSKAKTVPLLNRSAGGVGTSS